MRVIIKGRRNSMQVTNLLLDGLKLIRPNVYEDERGFFLESYRLSLYKACGIEVDFVQDNHSFSKRGTLRGMHFQRNPGQAKLISVAYGRIFDVAVDIRIGSPTFGHWEGVYLDGTSHEQLFIPSGFAHGFCVLSEEAHLLYKVSSFYDPGEERAFRFDDPTVGIAWPIESPLLSEKDQKAPPLEEVLQ